MIEFKYDEVPTCFGETPDVSVHMTIADQATADEICDVFFRFLLATGFGPESIAGAMSATAQEYLPDED